MASNRKKKKAAKAAEKANGKPNTSVGDAINRAKDQKAKSPGAPVPKIIKGFGRKPDAKVTHAVTSINNAALCDPKIIQIEVKDYLLPKDVTCAKCKKRADFKKITDASWLKSKPKGKTPVKKDEVKTKKAKPKTKPPEGKSKASEASESSKSVTDEYSEDVIDGMFEKLRIMMDVRFKKIESRVIKKMEKYCETILDARPMFFIVRKANNMYEVIHDASRYVICDNVKESDAEALLVKYLEISPKWDGQTKPSKQWLSALRKIHEEHFPKKSVGKSKTRTLKRRPRPSIKRRKDRKSEKRVIKRRSK